MGKKRGGTSPIKAKANGLGQLGEFFEQLDDMATGAEPHTGQSHAQAANDEELAPVTDAPDTAA